MNEMKLHLKIKVGEPEDTEINLGAFTGPWVVYFKF